MYPKLRCFPHLPRETIFYHDSNLLITILKNTSLHKNPLVAVLVKLQRFSRHETFLFDRKYQLISSYLQGEASLTIHFAVTGVAQLPILRFIRVVPHEFVSNHTVRAAVQLLQDLIRRQVIGPRDVVLQSYARFLWIRINSLVIRLGIVVSLDLTLSLQTPHSLYDVVNVAQWKNRSVYPYVLINQEICCWAWQACFGKSSLRH